MKIKKLLSLLIVLAVMAAIVALPMSAFAAQTATRISANDLQTGDRVIIVCIESNYPKGQATYPAFGPNNSGPFIEAAVVTLSDDGETATWEDENVQEMTVSKVAAGGTDEFKYEFTNKDGILSGNASVSRALAWGRTYSNEYWQFDVNDGNKTCQIKAYNNGDWTIRYNDAANPSRFTMYSGGQKPTMAVFKIKPPYTVEKAKVGKDDTGMQAVTENGLGTIRFGWQIFFDGYAPANLGACIIDWTDFEDEEIRTFNGDVSDIEDEGIFSADLTDIPETAWDNTISAYPFVNGQAYTEAKIEGTVNGSIILQE